MGYELNKLLRQYGVSSPTRGAPLAPLAPIAPAPLKEGADEAAKARNAQAVAAYNAAAADYPAAMERYKANLAAYEPYSQEYQRRLRETPMYLQSQFAPPTTMTTPPAMTFSPAQKAALSGTGIGLDAMQRNIQNYFRTNPTATPEQIAQEQKQWGVSDRDIRNAMGPGFQFGAPAQGPLSFEEWHKDKMFPQVINADGSTPARNAYEKYVQTFVGGGVPSGYGSTGLKYANAPSGIGEKQYYANIRDWIAAHPNASYADILAEANKWGVSNPDLYKATGSYWGNQLRAPTYEPAKQPQKPIDLGGLVLPQNWNTKNAQEKITWFNQNNVSPDALRKAGVPEEDIQWMLNNGYLGAAPSAGSVPSGGGNVVAPDVGGVDGSVGGGGNGGSIADVAPGGQGVSNTAAELGLTMMGVPAFGLAGLGVNALGSLIAGQQADAMGQAAQTLSDMSAVPGITTISDPSGNVFGVSSPANIAAADAAIFGTSLTPSEEAVAEAMAAIAEANAAANGPSDAPSDGTGPAVGDSVTGVDGVYRQGGLAKMKRFSRGGLNKDEIDREAWMRYAPVGENEASTAVADEPIVEPIAEPVVEPFAAVTSPADKIRKELQRQLSVVAKYVDEGVDEDSIRVRMGAVNELRDELRQVEPDAPELRGDLPVSIAEMAKNYDVAPATEVERLAASYGVQPSSEAAPEVALPVALAAPVTTSPAATPAEMPLAAPPATTTPVSPAALDLATLLRRYTTEDSTYGPELREARKLANAETAAFQKMIAEAMKQEAAPTDKAEMYFRLAAAFGSPTKTGHFAESLGAVGKELGEMKKEERATKRAERQARLQLGLEAQKLKTQAAKEELGTLRSLAAEEMKDKRAILTEYLKSGRPQSEAGKMAEDAGLTRGTPEYTAFVNRYIDEKITSGNAIREAMVLIAQGNLAVAQAGLGVRQSAEQRAVEKETREQTQLSPAELKLKLEAEQSVGGLNDSMSALRRAYSLNPQTFDATLLDIGRQKLLEQTNPNDPRVLATREQANLLSKGAIEKLRSSFGGNPTEGERAALLALEGMDSKSKEERARIMRNTFDLLKARRDRENKRLQDIVSGKYRQKSTSEPEGID